MGESRSAYSLHDAADVHTPAVTVACPIQPYNDPAENPYRVEFACALAFLVTVFVVWRRIRPPARRLLRIYAGTSGALAFLITQVQACDCYFDRADRVQGCRLTLELSLVVGASLLLEILGLLLPRNVLSRAIARTRRAARFPRS